ncbi:hypothetical protein [Psychromicrobium sp. YIM B11713]|uniref:hypothetical protein n=1 Tax=Psychromicrobium sp. YIM B11713 TaxID=3145233 RepID=UPI00374F15F9
MRLLRILPLILISLFALSITAAAPAQASGELELSANGVAWSQALPGPIFSPTEKLVPGGSVTASFWVRNAGTSAAKLSVELTQGSLGQLFQRNLVELSLRSDQGTQWQAVPGSSAPGVLLAQIAVGKAEKLTLRISLRAEAANDTQLQQIPVDVRLILGGSTSPVKPPGPVGPNLPNTGFVLFPAVLGLALLGGGGLAWGLARRRPQASARGGESE